MKMCLKWQVLAGAAVAAAGVWLVAPGLLGAAMPLLIMAVCPLSMLLMMRGASAASQACSAKEQPAGDAPGDVDARIAALQAQVRALKAEQAATTATGSPRT